MTKQRVVKWTGTNINEINALCKSSKNQCKAKIGYADRLNISIVEPQGYLVLDIGEYLIESKFGGLYKSATNPETYM